MAKLKHPHLATEAARLNLEQLARLGAGPRPDPPAELGLVWCDARRTRLFAWRNGHGSNPTDP